MIVEHVDHWRWGLRWYLIPWRYRWQYLRNHPGETQLYFGMRREWA